MAKIMANVSEIINGVKSGINGENNESVMAALKAAKRINGVYHQWRLMAVI
jgi:hypothetical protein